MKIYNKEALISTVLYFSLIILSGWNPKNLNDKKHLSDHEDKFRNYYAKKSALSSLQTA